MKQTDIQFYKISRSMISGEKEIKAVMPYDSYAVFKNPALLADNNKFTVAKGRNTYDVVPYQDVFNFAISEKLKIALEQNGITGWLCYPIIIDGIEGNYFGFWVTGKGGKVTKFDKDGAIPMFKPLKWDQAAWDGSDIFNIEDTGIKACTPRAAEIFLQFNCKSIIVRPL